MNLSKWPPEYDSVKVIIFAIVLVVAGFFVYKYMQNGFGSTGRVINTRRGAPESRPIPSLPILSLAPVSGITKTSAVLNATIPVMDESNTASLTFEYGLTEEYGNILQPTIQDGKASATVTILLCGKTYHYRLIAKNAVGMSGSESKTFRTLACR